MLVNKEMSNWGNFPLIRADFSEPSDIAAIKAFISDSEHLIPRGMGRCYGDSALQNHILSTLELHCFLAFDENTGIVSCQSGVTFDDILRVFVPRGWFLPVTPGTKFVTVGGALASDVHGKNHHTKGTFSDHVLSFQLITPDAKEVNCSREENELLFRLTCGGMGLTGLITTVTFKLQRIETAYIRQEQIKAKNLDEIISLFEESASYTYSMAWIDCLSKGKNMGRSIMMRGENATLAELDNSKRQNPLKVHQQGKLNVPFYFPSFMLNSLSVKIFNAFYYHKQWQKSVMSLVHYDPFYYPLDAIHNWNRIYGKNGFTQYQFVIPKENGRDGLEAIISYIGKHNMGSFLTVLKLFGNQPDNFLRFPMEGYTLAMDFKIQPKLWVFLDGMDEMVQKYGGRVYLTKDVRMRKDFLMQTYPEAKAFEQHYQSLNPDRKFSSLQSERIFKSDLI